MSVYVDDMRTSYGRMVMCHMTADSTEELLAMADRVGVARRWIQRAGTPWEHFDICLTKRRLAVKAGAVETTAREQARRRVAAAQPEHPCHIVDCERPWPHEHVITGPHAAQPEEKP